MRTSQLPVTIEQFKLRSFDSFATVKTDTLKLEVSRVLVDRGANVNARIQKHWTPIHISARNGHLENAARTYMHGMAQAKHHIKRRCKEDIERLLIYSGRMARVEKGSRRSFHVSNAMSDGHFDFST
jgi:hypothetical protein